VGDHCGKLRVEDFASRSAARGRTWRSPASVVTSAEMNTCDVERCTDGRYADWPRPVARPRIGSTVTVGPPADQIQPLGPVNRRT